MSEIQPKNMKNNTKKRLDQILFKPVILRSFIIHAHVPLSGPKAVKIVPAMKRKGSNLKDNFFALILDI